MRPESASQGGSTLPHVGQGPLPDSVPMTVLSLEFQL